MTATLLGVFGEDQVVGLTGLSKGQLRAWDRRGFFKPRYAYEDRRAPYARLYSFRDLVGLRTIAVLMKEHHVSLRELLKVASELKRRGYDHWVDLKLYVVNRQVHFQPPASPHAEGVWDHQLAMVPVIDVMGDIEARVHQGRERNKAQYGRIERHKHVVRNADVVAGTRIPIAAIRRFNKAGYSVADIIREYPTLTAKDVKAALAFEERLAESA